MNTIEFANAIKTNNAGEFCVNEMSSNDPVFEFATDLSRAKSVRSWMDVCMEGNFPGDMGSCGFVNARMIMARNGREAFETTLHKFLPKAQITELCDAIVACRCPEFLTPGNGFTSPRHTHFSFEEACGVFRATMIEQINDKVWVGQFVGVV